MISDGNGYHGNCGFGGDGAWWLLVLFLFAFAGNSGWGGFGGGNTGGVVPYMMSNNTNNDVQRGFDQQAVMSAIGGVGTSVTTGFANAEVARCNSTTAILQALAANNASSMQNFNTLAMALQQCCCDNRASIADVKYAIATENCADRAAVNEGVRDIIAQNTGNTNNLLTAMNNGFQGLQDKLCQLELDGIKRDYDNQLRTMQNQLQQTQNELAAARSAAAVNAQTATILANNEAQTSILENYLYPQARPAYVVPNPNTGCCGYNQGCCA